MRALVVLGALAMTLTITSSAGPAPSRCRPGSALAFVAIQDRPPYLIGTAPSAFTGSARFFSRRFNCFGQSAQIRRVGLGIYDVRFPELRPRLALVTAISEEGVSASAHPLGDGVVRVSLRGPLAGSDVASRRDVPFSLVIY